MDIFAFEELVSDMLDITDEQRNDDDFVERVFFEKFGIDIEQGFELAKSLIPHIPKTKFGFSGCSYHAFVSRKFNVMLMGIKA